MEIAILGPALILVTFAVVQAGLVFYARALAMAAAQAGVTAARSYHAPAGAGVLAARTFLTDHAGDSLREGQVTSVANTDRQVRIVVSGRSLSVLPGVPGITVRQVAQGEKERFTTEDSP